MTEVRKMAARKDLHLGHVMRTERRLARTNSPTKKNPLMVLNVEAVDRVMRSLPGFFGDTPPPGSGAAASIRRQITIAESVRILE